MKHKFCYSVHKSQPLVPVLSHMKAVYTQTPYIFKINYYPPIHACIFHFALTL
jgi:hypothetical protein